jgi:feruloyl esterase
MSLHLTPRAMRPLARLGLLLALTAGGVWAQAADSCSALQALRLPQARIVSTASLPAGERVTLWPGGTPQVMPKSLCRVRGVASPVVGSAIGFEVWLPDASAWNGKFLQAGNGGTAGSIPMGPLLDALGRGYAAAATDGGHLWPDGLDYGWASGRPEAVVDFGWRAMVQTTQVAQRIVKARMAKAPRRSYFVGCSNGGRDALMAAQRMPRAFDGIVAGAPALAWIDLMSAHAMLQRDLGGATPPLPAAKLPAIQAAALAACGQGRGFVPDPPSCRFDPAVLTCQGEDTASCLTPRQVEIVRLIYRGLPDASTGRTLPGLMPGAEAEPGNWDFWLLLQPTNPMGPSNTPPTSIGQSFFRHLVRQDLGFQLADLGNADMVQARRRWSADLDATQTDLRPFLRRGGKLLHYHGWADSAIPPGMSLDYFAAVQRRVGPTPDAYRLFMVPGMNHCGGGQGPWQVDWLDALERWVERGQPPQEITARHPGNGQTQVLRPVPHP